MLYPKSRLHRKLTFGLLLCLCVISAQAALAQGQGPLPATSDQNNNAQAKPKAPLDTYLDAQLAREKAKQHTYYEGLAKNASETGQYQAGRLRAQAATKPAPVYVPNDNVYQPMAARVPGYTPSTLPSRTPVYVSQDLEYAKMKEEMAQEKAEQLRKVSAAKEADLEQSLENMKSQMKDSHVPGAAVAKPEGSSLFVRYYGPSSTSKPYEVHPAAARIVPHQ